MQSSPVRTKLFLMMVLELAIWGAWLPLIFAYLPSLNFPPISLGGVELSATTQISLILNAFPVAAVIGMFFSNQFADRNFSAERFLAFSHFVGGLAMLALFWVTTFPLFFALMLVHCLLYVPTLSIANSIAFANLRDPQREFGLVRMGGTVGWILVAWPFTFILVDWDKVQAAHPQGIVAWIGAALSSPAAQSATKYTYLVSGLVSLALSAFSLTLPHTPAKGARGPDDKLAWLEAMRLLRHPYLLVLWVVAFIDSFVHNCFFNWAGMFFEKVGIAHNWVMPVMSIGQIMEILTMFILGGTLRRLGWKVTMCVGVFGYAVRFAVFAFLPQYTTLIVLVNVLHGLCYAFFFATVYIFVDAYLPKDARASAQGLFNVMILGVGCMTANFVCPWLTRAFFTHDGVVDFAHLFLIPCGAAVLATLSLALFFNPPPQPATVEGAPALPH